MLIHTPSCRNVIRALSVRVHRPLVKLTYSQKLDALYSVSESGGTFINMILSLLFEYFA